VRPRPKAARAEGGQDASGASDSDALGLRLIPVGGVGPLHAHQFISLKPEGQLRLRQHFIAIAQQIAVVPAVFMEGVLR
jgi:hypothetical protein